MSETSQTSADADSSSHISLALIVTLIVAFLLVSGVVIFLYRRFLLGLLPRQTRCARCLRRIGSADRTQAREGTVRSHEEDCERVRWWEVRRLLPQPNRDVEAGANGQRVV
ncbi:hypothetical protein JCM24511_06281 [Saitozyma sp. JCM 24511]|nr:hypothetical protein JCM24511_06281 [Saitozyma sp. JCM 24511]